jgi:hypothetical protein
MSSGALPADVTVFQFLTDGTSIYSFARYWGGTGSTIGGGAYSGGIFVRGSSTSPGSRSPIFTGNYTTAQTSYMEFWTDSPHFCISVCGQASSGWTRGQSITVEIDGRRLFDGAVTPLTDFGANNYLTFDFRASGGQKSRRIRVMGAFSFFNAGYYFLATRGQDSIWQQPNPNRYRLAIVGDSLYGVTASGPLIPGFDRAKLLADFIGCDDIVNLSVGGTGFIANASGVGLNYAARITDLVTANPSIIWIGGALNDVVGTYTSAQRRAAALSYLQQVRQLLPNAMIIMGGTVGNTNSLANNQTIEGDCFAAVDTFGDSNTYKIPASTATYPWLTGTGTLQGVTGVGNNDIYIGPTDTTHPSHTAIQYLARQDAVAFSNLISTL